MLSLSSVTEIALVVGLNQSTDINYIHYDVGEFLNFVYYRVDIW
jgi:hypothetical protein